MDPQRTNENSSRKMDEEVIRFQIKIPSMSSRGSKTCSFLTISIKKSKKQGRDGLSSSEQKGTRKQRAKNAPPPMSRMSLPM